MPEVRITDQKLQDQMMDFAVNQYRRGFTFKTIALNLASRFDLPPELGTVGRVSGLLNRARNRGIPVKRRIDRVPPLAAQTNKRVSMETRSYLAEHAGRRGITVATLVRNLLEVVAKDNLMDSILDDGE